MLREGRQGQPAAGVLQSLQSGQTHGSVDQQPLWNGLRGLWVGAADSHGDEVVRRQRCGLGQQRSAILHDSSLAVICSQFTASPSPPHPWLPSPSVRVTRASASEVCGKSIMNTKRLERGLSERQLSVFVKSWGPSVPPLGLCESQAPAT